MKPIIEVTTIGKKYKITHERGSYIALRDVLTNALRHPFAFLKRAAKQTLGIDTEVFWALQDVSFAVQKGEVVGIIGHNGAGKSTLLKILSQITPPTTGEIRLHGTVGSLLEVGTGFHPELTGRENIMLNGAILGMKKSEIVRKFDEIVAFAGIEQFLDTPVKYYSSGMYVRLAFSVAAHLEPDILIVDEVLAVGDAEFQKKCLGKMREITKTDGRTILFVSHNMDAIRRLCTKTILLEKGRVVAYGDTDTVIEQYTQRTTSDGSHRWVRDTEVDRETPLVPEVFEVVHENGAHTVRIQATLHEPLEDLTLGYALYTENGELLYWSYQTDSDPSLTLKQGHNTLTSTIPADLLNNGTYTLELIGGIHGKKWFFEPGKGNPTIVYTLTRSFGDHPYWNQRRPGILAPQIPWKHS